MTTYVSFLPPPTTAFQFPASLDLQLVNCYVPWSLFGNRWYLTVADTNGSRIFTRALVGSQDGFPIKSMTWANGIVKVETSISHKYDFMSTTNLTISGCSPNLLNGLQSCFITGDSTFVYNLAQDPGIISQFGRVDYNINLAEGYYATSTLVFRDSSQTFEINP